ncbi:TetR/AcrR family transcriptional regulator [Streptomyces sp. MA5143a]|uniref:TetR/AcrR family transcriptional regulator n=1 Tax=Streptomyces sp. MA5143a TaxID=2083010 RepID=UPI0035C017D7
MEHQEAHSGARHVPLRGRLIGALTLGTAVTRYVLKFSEVEEASVDDLVECLRPAVEALMRPPGEPEAAKQTDAGPPESQAEGHGSAGGGNRG